MLKFVVRSHHDDCSVDVTFDIMYLYLEYS